GSVSDPVVQVALIAESTKLQTTLSTYGIQAQTPHQVEPVQIWSPNEMVKLLELIGKNDRLMLSGRPPRPIGALGTSKIYQIFGDTVISYGILFEMNDFYMSFDPAILIDDIKKDLKFISQRWKLGGRPTFCFLLREDNVSGAYFSQMLDLLVSIKNGNVDGVRVRVGRVQNLLSAGCVEHLDFPISIKAKFIVKPLREVSSDIDLKGSLQDISKASQSYMMDSDFNVDTIKIKSTEELVQMFRNVPVASLYTQTQFLRLLLERHGPHYRIEDTTTVREKLDKICRQAALGKNWFVVRLCAGLLGKTVDSLAPSITSILVRGKKVTVGVFGHEEKIIEKPVTPDEVAAYIYSNCSPYDISLAVLEQELIIALGHYTTAEPQLFTSILKIRIGWIIHAIDLLLNYESGKKTVSVTCLSPTEVKQILRDILSMKRFSRLSNVQQRQLNGSLGRVPPDFYERIWKVVAKTPEGIIVNGHHLPQQPTLSDMTEYELTFAFTVDELLGNIAMPEYRQIMVEAFMVVSLILERNSELQFTRALNMDNIIFDAIETFQKEKRTLNMENTTFYDLPCSGRKGSAAYLARAVVNDLFSDNTVAGGGHDSHCTLS
uniref:Phosphorylase b kinase regulatory subunit n=1 Tax=Romanomermis culicivorax TaxID=13658 RepID=A0A915L0M6_ROMCU